MTVKIKVRPSGNFIFHDLRTGEYAFPGVDNVMTRSPLVEGKIYDGVLIEVKDDPEPEPKPKPKATKAAAE